MRMMSSGRYGDQVALTSALHQFQQPGCVTFDFLLEMITPGNSSTLSVYLLTKHRVPTKLHVCSDSQEGWAKSRVYVPSGLYHVMFLATVGRPYRSDIYIDNIAIEPSYACTEYSSKLSGNFSSKCEFLWL